MIQKPEIDISPKEYEDFVKEWFDEEFGELNDYESKVRTKEQAHDGEFEIDIKIKFRLSGFDFLKLRHQIQSSSVFRNFLFCPARQQVLLGAQNYRSGCRRYQCQ